MSVKFQKTDSVPLKRMKRKKKWQLLAINESGKVVSLGGLKKFFWLSVFLGLMFLVAGGWGTLQYKAETDEVARMKLHLETALQQMKILQADTDRLFFHVMNAESLSELRSVVQKENSLSLSNVPGDIENSPEYSETGESRRTAVPENQESGNETEE